MLSYADLEAQVKMFQERRMLGTGMEKCEAVEARPALYWNPQDVGDDRAVRYLSRGAACRQ